MFSKLKYWIYNYIIKKVIIETDAYIFISMIYLNLVSIFTILNLSKQISDRSGLTNDLIFFIRHIIYIIIGLIIYILIININKKRIYLITKYLGIAFIGITACTTFFAPVVNGARRWIKVGGLSFQPSEILKVLILFLSAKLLLHNQHKLNAVLLLICISIVIFQPDIGMSLLIIVGFATQIFLLGKYVYQYLLVATLGALTGILAIIFSTTYVIDRLLIFVGKKAGYQITQSLTALRNSKFLGQSDYLVYIPDSHCDLIFAYIAQTHGIIINILIIIIPFVILWRIIINNYKYTLYDKIVIYSIVGQYYFQHYFHILSNMRFLPSKGVILPLVSYGGTGIIIYSFIFGFINNLVSQEHKI